MKDLTTKTFDETVAKGLHIVDFWAAWCGPCRMQAPILEELEKEYTPDQLQIGKVNVDEEQELAVRFGVQSIPTLLVFSDGRLVDRLVGVRMKEALMQEVNNHLA